MRRNIAMALLAVAIATGCAHTPGPCDLGPGYQDDTPSMGTRGAMCGWHTPEAHANAIRKGYTLECEGGAK